MDASEDSFVAAAAEQAPLSFRLSAHEYRSVDRKVGAALVLLANVLERAAYFALTSNMVYYLTRAPLCWNDDEAATAGLLFSGASYLLCLPSGFFADAGASKFVAAAVGYVVYLAGYAFVPVIGLATSSQAGAAVHENNASSATCRDAEHANDSLPALCFGSGGRAGAEAQPCATALYSTLAVISVGAALLQTNLPTFGADQVNQHGLAFTRGFISWFYWTRNAGALIANSAIAYLQIGVNGFFASALAALGCLALSAVVFTTGFKFYRRLAANRPAIRNFFAILPEALRVKKQMEARRRQQQQGPAGSGPATTLDYAKGRFGGSYHEKAVEEVKSSGRMLLVFALLVFYWIGFSQLTNSFQIQGLHMRLPGSGSTSIPPALLLLFDNVSVLVTLPLLDNVVYPYIGRRGHKLTLHIRMATGMLFATLAFAVAGCVEHFRLLSLKAGIFPQLVGYTIYDAAQMSVFVQVPQYMLLGVSQAFTIVTAMEYSYILAPKAMSSVMMGALFAVAGICVFISSLLPYVQKRAFGWTSINRSHMDWIYFGLAAVQLASAVAFYILGSRFNLGLDKLTIETARSRPRHEQSLAVPGAEAASVTPSAAAAESSGKSNTGSSSD